MADIKLTTRILGFLSFNLIGTLLLVVGAALLAGLYLFPREVGLYFVVPYYTYTLLLRRDELRDGTHWPSFSKHFIFFPAMRRYLNLEIACPLPKELKEEDKKPGAQFVLAVFPHGANCDYRVIMDGMLDDALPNTAHKVRALAATVLFRLPIVREIALWTGCVDARRSVADSLLKRGYSFLVLPGGMAEQIRTIRGREEVYLKKRKGFVKLAMRHGVPVIPMYVFGASDYYYTSRALYGFRLWLMNTLAISIPLAFGSYGSFLCPLPIKSTIVFGKLLHFKLKEKGSPTPEEVEAAHADFIVALTSLFDEHKERLGYGDRTLEIN